MATVEVFTDGDSTIAGLGLTEAEAKTALSEAKPLVTPQATNVSEAVAAPESVSDTPSDTKDSTEPETTEAKQARDEKGRYVKAADEPKETVDEKRSGSDRRIDTLRAKIDELTYERREEERRIDRLRQERQQLEAKHPSQTTAPPAPSNGGVPSFSEFLTTYAKDHPDATYADAQDAYNAVRDPWMRQQIQQEIRAEQDRKAFESRLTQHNERMKALEQTNPELQTQIQQSNRYLADRGVSRLPDVVAFAIFQSGKSEQIVQDFAWHPEVAYQWAVEMQDQPATPAAVKLMQTVLESRLVGAAPAPQTPAQDRTPRQSQSNPPPKPVGSSPLASSPAADELSYAQHQEAVRKIMGRR